MAPLQDLTESSLASFNTPAVYSSPDHRRAGIEVLGRPARSMKFLQNLAVRTKRDETGMAATEKSEVFKDGVQTVPVISY